MRRILMLVAVALVMAAMMAVNAGPAFAQFVGGGGGGCNPDFTACGGGGGGTYYPGTGTGGGVGASVVENPIFGPQATFGAGGTNTLGYEPGGQGDAIAPGSIQEDCVGSNEACNGPPAS